MGVPGLCLTDRPNSASWSIGYINLRLPLSDDESKKVALVEWFAQAV